MKRFACVVKSYTGHLRIAHAVYLGGASASMDQITCNLYSHDRPVNHIGTMPTSRQPTNVLFSENDYMMLWNIANVT